jgi:hypothetical protein
MGFFSSVWRGVKSVAKGVVKGAKKVVKSVGKVVKKVVKGVGKAVKSVGKAFSKLGPLASIALNFILPGAGAFASMFTGPYAALYGAMAKGAVTGFITSGGDIKGALVGAAGGAIGHGASKVFEGAKTGWNASEGGLTDKISGAIKGGASTISEGWTSLTEGSQTFLNEGGNINSPQAGQEISYKTNKININESGDYKTIPQQTQQMWAETASIGGEEDLVGLAKEGGYNENVAKNFYKDFNITPKHFQGEVVDYMDQTSTGLEQGTALWEQTGGAQRSMSFDYEVSKETGAYEYTGGGLKATTEATQYPINAIPTQTTKLPKLKTPTKLKTPEESSLLSTPSTSYKFTDPNEAPTASSGTRVGGSMTSYEAQLILSDPKASQDQRLRAQQTIANWGQSQNLISKV